MDTATQQQAWSCTARYGMDELHDVDPHKLGTGTLVGKHPEDGGLMVVFPVDLEDRNAVKGRNVIRIDGAEIAVIDCRGGENRIHVISACRQWWEEFELSGVASGLIRVSLQGGVFECSKRDANNIRAVYGGTHYVKETCLVLDQVDMEARTAFVMNGQYEIRWGRSGVFSVDPFCCIWHPGLAFTVVPFEGDEK